MKKQMLNKKGNGGITLIALVITIVVLLILAGVSIAMLTGDNGILTQANKAKEETQKAEIKERLQLEVLGELVGGTINLATLKENINKNIPGAIAYATGKIEYNGEIYAVESSGKITGPMEGELAKPGEKVEGTENKFYINNGTAVIPVGFTIVPGLDNVYEGLVISDNENDTELDADETKHVANGNQFVWIPVDKNNFATEFVREHFGTAEQKWWTGTFVKDGLIANNMYEPVADGLTVDTTASSSVQEVQKMYKSVRDNGGFYIGRYEAGNDGSNNVLCKKGVNVYNKIGWADTDDMIDETGGAVEKARGFSEANNYTSVTSTLVYGVQWDAVLRWISKDNELKGYLTNSTSVGNYTDSDSTNNPAKTGAVKEYQLKNIYDMAGNIYEWTMESYNTFARVYRGGYYYYDGAYYPVSCRNYYYPSGSDVGLGFRVALYL